MALMCLALLYSISIITSITFRFLDSALSESAVSVHDIHPRIRRDTISRLPGSEVSLYLLELFLLPAAKGGGRLQYYRYLAVLWSGPEENLLRLVRDWDM